MQHKMKIRNNEYRTTRVEVKHFFRQMRQRYPALGRPILHLLAILALMMGSTAVNAQNNTHVHNGASLHVFSGNNMSVWGDATNEGSWGSQEGGIVRFYGVNWENDEAATMPGAGLFWFQQPRPAPYNNNVSQYLDGGYDMSGQSGCSFPDIRLENSNNLYLTTTDGKTRDTFEFSAGHVIHDGNNFTVGHNDPGDILGYTETSFFVTNGTGTSNIGYLEREGLSSGDLEQAFPIGVAIGDYTPGRIKNVGTDDDYGMRVFANVYDAGYSGTTHNDASVARTWDVEERNTGGSNVTLELQHNSATEGGTFATYNSNHYITHYTGTSPNGPGSNGVDTTSVTPWDLLKYSNLYAGEAGTGYITTGSAISGAVVTKRSSLDAFSPYTKTVYDAAPLPVSLINLDAQWKQNDGEVVWATAMELNNAGFRVERSIDGAPFIFIADVPSKALVGNANEVLTYTYTDKQVRHKVEQEVLYRLVQHDFDGTEEVFGPLALYTSKTTKTRFNVYPNPSGGQVYVSLTGLHGDNHKVVVTNMAGQVVHQTTADGETLERGYLLHLTDVPTGIYVIQVSNGNVLKTKRINISHNP